MQRKHKVSTIILGLCLTMILTTSCLTNQEPSLPPLPRSKPEYTGINLCVADLKMFYLNEEEIKVWSKDNKLNASQLNCLLHQKCGRPLENGDLCNS